MPAFAGMTLIVPVLRDPSLRWDDEIRADEIGDDEVGNGIIGVAASQMKKAAPRDRLFLFV